MEPALQSRGGSRRCQPSSAIVATAVQTINETANRATMHAATIGAAIAKSVGRRLVVPGHFLSELWIKPSEPIARLDPLRFSVVRTTASTLPRLRAGFRQSRGGSQCASVR